MIWNQRFALGGFIGVLMFGALSLLTPLANAGFFISLFVFLWGIRE